MPLSDQIVITPEVITTKNFAISAVTRTSSTATYTATGHTFAAGDIVLVTGIAPDGYNGTFTITSVATNTFTVSNSTNLAITDAVGDAFSADAAEYEYEGFSANFLTDNDDVTVLIDANESVIAAANEAALAAIAATQAQAQADIATANAAFAQTAAGNAQTTANGKNKIYRQGTTPTGTFVVNDIWYDTSTGNKPYTWDGSSWVSVQDASIATTLSVANAAQTTANGKNKITYSASAPGSTANTAGDIWWQFSGGSIIGQWTGAGGTSWTSTVIGNSVIANIDAGKITAGTISVAISLSAATITGGSINIGSGVFVVSSGGAVTITSGSFNINTGTFIVSSLGKMTCSDVVITGGTLTIGSNFGVTNTGKLTANDIAVTGGTLTIGTKFSVSNTGVLTASGGEFNGKIIADSGYIGSLTNGWNFTSTGYIQNNDLSSVFYPTATANPYLLISDRSISVNGVQSSGNIITTGTARVNAQGTNSNRCEFNYFNTIQLHSISSGYGVDSDWSPNSDNAVDLGQAGGTNRRWRKIYSNSTTISTSDARLKTDVTDSPLGLEFISSLRPVNYRWITGSQEVVKDVDGKAIITGESPEGKPIFEMKAIPGKRLHYGFIAQEVKAALDASGVTDFAGWVQDDLTNPDSTQSLSYEQFIAPLVKAVQELTNRVKTLEGE